MPRDERLPSCFSHGDLRTTRCVHSLTTPVSSMVQPRSIRLNGFRLRTIEYLRHFRILFDLVNGVNWKTQFCVLRKIPVFSIGAYRRYPRDIRETTMTTVNRNVHSCACVRLRTIIPTGFTLRKVYRGRAALMFRRCCYEFRSRNILNSYRDILSQCPLGNGNANVPHVSSRRIHFCYSREIPPVALLSSVCCGVDATSFTRRSYGTCDESFKQLIPKTGSSILRVICFRNQAKKCNLNFLLIN